MRFVLASTSPRRSGIMRAAGMTLVIQTGAPPTEVLDDAGDAAELTAANAAAKLARAVGSTRGRLPWDAALVAADTLVHRGGRVYGKPASASEALDMLQDLRGTTHHVTTSVAMTYSPMRQLGQTAARTVTSDVVLGDLSDTQLADYLERGHWRQRAGAYGVQDVEVRPFAAVQGCYLNVVGLPLCAVADMLPPDAAPFTAAHIYATCAAHLEGSPA